MRKAKEPTAKDLLKDYKREVKKLSFTEKVKAYFDCQPWVTEYDGERRALIYEAFKKGEREEFRRTYLPIYLAIDKHGDRVRLLQERCNLYTVYIENLLRLIRSSQYTADFLNKAITELREACEELTERKARDAVNEALIWVKGYRQMHINAPQFLLTQGEGKEKFLVDYRYIKLYIENTTRALKSHLSLLKCYLDSLKEFLSWADCAWLYPKEFEGIEAQQKTAHPITKREELEEIEAQLKDTNKDFPLWKETLEVEYNYLMISYEELPYNADIFGDKNRWKASYLSICKR